MHGDDAPLSCKQEYLQGIAGSLLVATRLRHCQLATFTLVVAKITVKLHTLNDPQEMGSPDMCRSLHISQCP